MSDVNTQSKKEQLLAMAKNGYQRPQSKKEQLLAMAKNGDQRPNRLI
jgi:hypothetical protein